MQKLPKIQVFKCSVCHVRTHEDKYRGAAEYDTIRQVLSQVDIPVIANGDITSAKKAQQVLHYTGVAGIMIGRATQGNPWIINEIDHYLNWATCQNSII